MLTTCLIKPKYLSKTSHTLIVLVYIVLVIGVLSCSSLHAQSADRAFYFTTGIERGWGVSKLGEAKASFDFSGINIPVQSYRLEAGYRRNRFNFGLLYREGQNEDRGSSVSLDDLDRYWQVAPIVRYGFVKSIGKSPIIWGSNIGIAPGLFNYSYQEEQGTSGNNQSAELRQKKTQRLGIYADANVFMIGLQIGSFNILFMPSAYMDLTNVMINVGVAGSVSVHYKF